MLDYIQKATNILIYFILFYIFIALCGLKSDENS